MALGVNDRSSKEWMEWKVGASFSRRVQVSEKRVWLMDKRRYASIEKTVDIAVSRRFKKRGMSWYRQCANPLMKLRLLKLNRE